MSMCVEIPGFRSGLAGKLQLGRESKRYCIVSQEMEKAL